MAPVSKRNESPTGTVVLPSDPATARIGDEYFNSTMQAKRVYTSTGWVSVGSTDAGVTFFMGMFNG